MVLPTEECNGYCRHAQASSGSIVEEAAVGAAVGATRAVTDLGWVPSTHQVGLTGTSVA